MVENGNKASNEKQNWVVRIGEFISNGGVKIGKSSEAGSKETKESSKQDE